MTYPYTNYNTYGGTGGWWGLYPPTITPSPTQRIQDLIPPQPQPPVSNGVVPQQIQNGGVVYGLTEEEILNYPVAPGYQISFINTDKTCCYIKTMGFSQYDKPALEKFKMTKEESKDGEVSEKKEPDLSKFALRSDVDRLRTEIKKLKDKVAISDG